MMFNKYVSIVLCECIMNVYVSIDLCKCCMEYVRERERRDALLSKSE